MANRRMFAKSITNSSRFLMMPISAQSLYFHLGMNADDDGYCEHFTIMRMVNSNPDDLKVLATKGFVKVFDEQVLIIIEWKENNYLRPDRYIPSKYKEVYLMDTTGIPKTNQVVDVRETQVRLGKVRLGKVSIVKPFVDEIPKTDKKKELAHLSGKVIALFNKIKANGRDHDIENETHVKKFGIIIKALSKKGFKTDEQVLDEFERVFKHKKLQHDNQDHHWDHFRITTLSAKENFMAYRDEDDHEGIDLDEPTAMAKHIEKLKKEGKY